MNFLDTKICIYFLKGKNEKLRAALMSKHPDDKKIPFPPKIFGQFTANTWRAEYTEGIFDKSDIEVIGRTGFDNTKGSNLQNILTEKKIKKVYFIGFTTDHCVAEAMDTLLSDGYECILVSDCTATRNSKLQQKIEDKYNSIKSKQLLEGIKKLA